MGFWVGEGDDSGFYWAHGLYGVGYGGYIVNDVVKATLAPAPVATTRTTHTGYNVPFNWNEQPSRSLRILGVMI